MEKASAIVQMAHPEGRSASPDSHNLSSQIWRLYDAARMEDVPVFQNQVMTILAAEVPFDGAWWGHDVSTGSGFQVHGSYLLNLPNDAPVMLSDTDPRSRLVAACRAHPNRAVVFSADMLHASAASAAFSRHVGAHEVLAVAEVDKATNVSHFIALTRDADASPFCELDRQWLELLMPHVTAALNQCCSGRMAKWHAEHGGGHLLATADSKGFLHVIDPGLADLLHEEWPNWRGHRLPEALLTHLDRQQQDFDGDRVHAEFYWSGQRVFIPFRRRQARDRLTRRECAVAQAFASGQSYKEVAKTLGMAPATVRHHLRSAYLRLGINDKAALAQQMTAPDTTL